MQYPYITSHFAPQEPNPQVDFSWLSESFDLFKQQGIVWVLGVLILFAGTIIASIPGTLAIQFLLVIPTGMSGPSITQALPYSERLEPFNFLNWLFYTFVASYLYSGLLRIAIRQVRGEHVEAGDIFRGWPNTLRVFGLTFLFSCLYFIIWLPIKFLQIQFASGTTPSAREVYLMIGACLFFLVVLGNAGGLFLPAYALVADGEKVFRAMSRSFAAARQDWLRASLFLILYAIILMLSCIPCLIGCIVTVPMGALILALIYRDTMGMPAPPVMAYQIPYAEPEEGVWPPPPGQN